MLENGIKPVYVFDGKPPQLKSSEVSQFFNYVKFFRLKTQSFSWINVQKGGKKLKKILLKRKLKVMPKMSTNTLVDW